jgi:PilZ domain-containing protein
MVLSQTILEELSSFGRRAVIERIPHDDRRRRHRLPFLHRTKIDLPQQSSATILVRDVSEIGVGFISDTEMKADEEFILQIRRPSDAGMVRVRCVVRRCQPGGLEKTNFHIGGEFREVLPEPAQPAAPPPPQRPAFPPPRRLFQ